MNRPLNDVLVVVVDLTGLAIAKADGEISVQNDQTVGEIDRRIININDRAVVESGRRDQCSE